MNDFITEERNMSEKLSLQEAAELLGMSRQTLAKRLQSGEMSEVGCAYPPMYKRGKWHYDIYRSKVERYIE